MGRGSREDAKDVALMVAPIGMDLVNQIAKTYLEPQELNLSRLMEVYDRILGRTDPLDELLVKAGVKERDRDVRQADDRNQYDAKMVDYWRAIVKANLAQVWETREEGDTPEDIVWRTLGVFKFDTPEPEEEKDLASIVKWYGTLIGKGPAVGRLTGLV